MAHRSVASGASWTVTAIVLSSVTSCSWSAPDESGTSQTLTVYAAASLKKPFTQLGRDFERAHPGVKVKFNFAGSSDLVAQLQAGAAADVLATADERTMQRAASGKVVTATPQIFTRNKLIIAVPKGNPASVHAPADLTKAGLKLVMCAPQVPCGAAASAFEKKSHLSLKPVSEENKVTDVLGKVRSGDADAGIVYASDVHGSGRAIETVAIPGAMNVINAYPIATVSDSRHKDLANSFTALVRSASGQKTLAAAGFLPAQS